MFSSHTVAYTLHYSVNSPEYLDIWLAKHFDLLLKMFQRLVHRQNLLIFLIPYFYVHHIWKSISL